MFRHDSVSLAGLALIAFAAASPVSAQGTNQVTDQALTGRDGTQAQAVPSSDAVAAHETFRTRVSAEVEGWRLKMHVFDDKIEAGSKHQADASEARLRTAWDDTEAEARYVQSATSPDWDRAKRAYQAASHRLALAWAKVRS